MATIMRSGSHLKRQAGLALMGFLLFGGLTALLAIEAMRAIPLFLEYYEVRLAIKQAAASSNDPAEVRKSFDKYASVNNITSLTGQDLHVDKTARGLVAWASYWGWAHLFKDTYVVIQFKAASEPMKGIDEDSG